MRILLVEDQLLIAMEQRLYLEDAGHEVFGPAIDFSQTLHWCAQGPFDLALVDIHLANGSTGLEVAEHLERQGTRCLFVTSYPDDIAGQELGVGCLTKPFTRADLLTAVGLLDPAAAAEPAPAKPRNLVLFAALQE